MESPLLWVLDEVTGNTTRHTRVPIRIFRASLTYMCACLWLFCVWRINTRGNVGLLVRWRRPLGSRSSLRHGVNRRLWLSCFSVRDFMQLSCFFGGDASFARNCHRQAVRSPRREHGCVEAAEVGERVQRTRPACVRLPPLQVKTLRETGRDR